MESALHLFENNATIYLQVLKARVTFQNDWSLIFKFASDNFVFHSEPRNGQRVKMAYA